MKPYLLFFPFLLLLLAGCKKDAKQVHAVGLAYLIKYQIVSYEGGTFLKTDTTLYQYNDKNKLTDYGTISYGKYIKRTMFLYDSKDRVNEVDYYDASGNPIGGKTILTYGSNTVTVNTYSSDGTQVLNDKFTLNENQEVIRYDTYNYYEIMNYDNAGNLIAYQNYPEPGAILSPVSMYVSVSYDKYKNPFSALNDNIFFKEYFFNNNGRPFTPRSFVNNPLYSPYEYQYNSDGYLIKMSGLGVTTTYEYIVK